MIPFVLVFAACGPEPEPEPVPEVTSSTTDCPDIVDGTVPIELRYWDPTSGELCDHRATLDLPAEYWYDYACGESHGCGLDLEAMFVSSDGFCVALAQSCIDPFAGFAKDPWTRGTCETVPECCTYTGYTYFGDLMPECA